RGTSLGCVRRIKFSATSFVPGLKNEVMIRRNRRRTSIIKWQGYRVSASRLAESNFRYTHDHPLASRGVPVVLARAVTQTGWQAENLGRAAQSHRRDEPCKSPLGCTTYPW